MAYVTRLIILFISLIILISCSNQHELRKVLPNDFDWRNWQGENWMSPVKNQGDLNSCSEHSKAGAIEAQINIYYNQHIDADLSEQMMIDCKDNLNTTEIGCVIENTWPLGGISTETDYAYKANRGNCSDTKGEKWKINTLKVYTTEDNICERYALLKDEDDLKRMIINEGPADCFIKSLYHSMVLTGYRSEKSDWKTVEICEWGEFCYGSEGCIPETCEVEGSRIETCINIRDEQRVLQQSQIWTYRCEGNNDTLKWNRIEKILCEGICVNSACVNEWKPTQHQECSDIHNGVARALLRYSPNEGDTTWIFKDSYGAEYGNNGYVEFATPLENFISCSIPKGPITSSEREYEINCQDRDNDSYCYWGILNEKPESCPEYCKPEKDIDDTDREEN